MNWAREELRRALQLSPAVVADVPDFAVVSSGTIIQEIDLPGHQWWEALAAVRNQLRVDHLHTDGATPGDRRYALQHSSIGWRQRSEAGTYRTGQRETANRPFRYWQGVDHDTALSARRGSQIGNALNVLAGLPIPYQTSNGDKFTVESDGGRWPSPLSFRVRRIDGGHRVLTMLMKRSRPRGVRVTDQASEYEWSADWTRLEEFVRNCGNLSVTVNPRR